MNTFEEVIEAFGGATALAEAIGIKPVHAQTMKARDSIPALYWRDVVDAARQRRIKGVTLDVLAQISSAKLKEKRA